MTQHDNCSKSKAKTILENKIWARNSNFWNLNFYPQIGVFLLSPSNSYQGRKMKTRGWSPTEFVWRLCQIFSLKMAPRTKDLQCFHIKWTHCRFDRTDRIWFIFAMFPLHPANEFIRLRHSTYSNKMNLGDLNGKKAYLKSGIHRIKVILISLKHSLKNLIKFSVN